MLCSWLAFVGEVWIIVGAFMFIQFVNIVLEHYDIELLDVVCVCVAGLVTILGLGIIFLFLRDLIQQLGWC